MILAGNSLIFPGFLVNLGLFRSVDAGSSWEKLSILWPVGMPLGRAHALAIVPA